MAGASVVAESCGLTRANARNIAAALLAEDALTDEEIATQVGYSARSLTYWKLDPKFQALIAANQERLQAEALRYPIARKRNRMRRRNQRWEKGHALIDARAEALAGKTPGGETGLLVEQWRVIGSGENAEVVREYAVDTGLLKELRELEKEAAIEAGDREEPAANVAPLQKLYVGIVLEQV